MEINKEFFNGSNERNTTQENDRIINKILNLMEEIPKLLQGNYQIK